MEKSNNNINELLVFRNILNDNLIKHVIEGSDYYGICSSLISFSESEQLSGNLWENYFLNTILMDENIFSITCEKTSVTPDKSLYSASLHDIKILKDFFLSGFDCTNSDIINSFKPVNPCSHSKVHDKFDHLKKVFSCEKDTAYILDELINYYNENGCGILGKYSSFYWSDNGCLLGIKHPDTIQLDDLIGYEEQKKILIKNTEAFVNGHTANNVLLFGDKGTGKSSSVKALVNKYASRGLRLVEISKNQLIQFSEILKSIRNRGHRFIIFLDDLSFEEFETEYKCMKSIIEGGVETKPENVLIYATSNRRHLIKENWSDRNKNDEVHESDSVQEKLSLADRFGITITYLSPNQDEYFKIVHGLASKYNIDIPEEKLKQEAVKWELWYNGRSGRTAQQFINYLLSQQ